MLRIFSRKCKYSLVTEGSLRRRSLVVADLDTKRTAGKLFMWLTQSTTAQPMMARIIVWLAAIAIPFQGLPSAACGCVQVATLETAEAPSCCSQPQADQPACCSGAEVCRCGEASSCCQAKPSCCSDQTSSEAGCQCGDQCQCGTSNAPTRPAVPPVENNSPERIALDSAATAFFGSVFLPSTTRQHLGLSVGAHALTAHDCCVSLCRFTL